MEVGPLLSNEIIDASREGRIRGYECMGCGTKGIEVQVFCESCGSGKLKRIDLGTHGRVHTFTIQHIAPEAFLNESPYAWAVIELDDGVRTSGWIPSINSPNDLKVGQRVKIMKSYKPGMVFEMVQE